MAVVFLLIFVVDGIVDGVIKELICYIDTLFVCVFVAQ